MPLSVYLLTIAHKSLFALFHSYQTKEYLTQIAINAAETYKCKVYVNPNGTSKDIKDLQQVELKTGDTVITKVCK